MPAVAFRRGWFHLLNLAIVWSPQLFCVQIAVFLIPDAELFSGPSSTSLLRVLPCKLWRPMSVPSSRSFETTPALELPFPTLLLLSFAVRFRNRQFTSPVLSRLFASFRDRLPVPRVSPCGPFFLTSRKFFFGNIGAPR